MLLEPGEGCGEARNDSGRRYGAPGGELVNNGLLCGFASGAMG